MTEFQYLDEGNAEAQDRLATSFLLAQSSGGLARTGVLTGLVTAQTTTASGAVLVTAGAAVVQASVLAGVSLLVNDTVKTLNVFTANPMGGLPRNDIVAFDSITKAIIAITGVPNASPTDPTVPATACALSRLRHAASATTIPTAVIDGLRTFTAPFGGAVSNAESGALNGSSEFVVTHALGHVPASIQVTKKWTSSAPFRQSVWYITGATSTTFTVAFITSAGAFIVGELAEFYWSASA